LPKFVKNMYYFANNSFSLVKIVQKWYTYN